MKPRIKKKPAPLLPQQAEDAKAYVELTAIVDAAAETQEQRRERQRQEAQRIGSGDGEVAPPVVAQMTLQEMADEYVFISEGSRCAPRAAPHIALSLPDFRNHAKASLTIVGKRAWPTVDVWLGHPSRTTTHTLTFRPGAPEFTADPEGTGALNLWKPRVRPESTAADITPFLEHVAYLIPNEEERERFLSWLAHIEQRPGVLPHTSYLFVTPQTGIGRNWLTNLLARVWPGAVRLGFDLYGALHSGFNGPLSRRLLVVVDELKAGDSDYGQALKSLLTTEHRGINPKFGRQHIEFNCARWLMLSNHFDALPLEKTDRRVIVISNPVERKPQAYYTRLYGLIDDPDFANAIGNWLAARDIGAFNPSEPAPLTEAKTKAIEASAGEVQRALIQLRDSTSRQLMTANEVTEYLNQNGLTRLAPKAMAAAYEGAGFATCTKPITVNGKKTRIVALRDWETIKTLSVLNLGLRFRAQRNK